MVDVIDVHWNENRDYSSILIGSKLTFTNNKRDLGVKVNRLSRVTTQCVATVKKKTMAFKEQY